MLNGSTHKAKMPGIEEAVQREYHALRDFLARLEDKPEAFQPSTTVDEPLLTVDESSDRVLQWWVTLKGVERLTEVAALRDRLAAMPGCVAAHVLYLSSAEIRIGVTTSIYVSQKQVEFAVSACGQIAKSQTVILAPDMVG